MTLGSHQTTIGKTQNHITPRGIINALGPFDLDPCAADPRPWPCARTNWTSGGLERPWPRECFIYLNPPFDRYEVGDWIRRLAEHGNGITLLHARTEAEWFEPIWQHATCILFMADRIHFHKPDGSRQPANSGAPPILAAFGAEAAARLHRCGWISRLGNLTTASPRSQLTAGPCKQHSSVSSSREWVTVCSLTFRHKHGASTNQQSNRHSSLTVVSHETPHR